MNYSIMVLNIVRIYIRMLTLFKYHFQFHVLFNDLMLIGINFMYIIVDLT
jgi:hypothetical protein